MTLPKPSRASKSDKNPAEGIAVPLPRLYGELAWLWPLISPPQDYASEAAMIRALIREHLGAAPAGERHRLLDLGTGGGHMLSHLKDDFACTAVDASSAMLENARRLNPQVTHHVGDMRSVRLNKTFDAVVMHDAIDYMVSAGEVLAALVTAASHLRREGVVVFSPTYVAETFQEHHIEHDRHSGRDIDVTYVSYEHDPDPGDTSIELVLLFLIRQNGQLRVEEDRHRIGLLSIDQWLGLLSEAGFAGEARPLMAPAARGAPKPWDRTPVFIGRRQ